MQFSHGALTCNRGAPIPDDGSRCGAAPRTRENDQEGRRRTQEAVNTTPVGVCSGFAPTMDNRPGRTAMPPVRPLGLGALRRTSRHFDLAAALHGHRDRAGADGIEGDRQATF